MTHKYCILHNRRMYRRFTLLTSVSVAATSLLTAQTTDSEDDFETDDDNIYVLSPFEVDASGDAGYYTSNTLAGSRLNTKISDLASSITVVNLEQMEDTASVDINDVLRYEANTEGASTYTEGISTMRSDGLADTNSGFTDGGDGNTQGYATANRIRGIGRPGTTTNYYPSLSGVPFDSYNTGSVEISRGPNSLLFGMGNPAGIVNQSTASASFGNDSTKIKLRTDDHGSFRASLSLNREIVDDTLAVYAAFLLDNREFSRKPSYDDTERAYFAVTYKPFEKTTFKVNFENYSNDHSRPNSLTPRDGVTQWREGGMWGYNPSNGMLTNAAGETKGPYVGSRDNPMLDQTRAWVEAQPGFNASLWNEEKTAYNGVNIYGGGALTDKDSILYTPGIGWGNTNRPKFRMLNGQVVDYLLFSAPRYRDGYGTAENPSGNADFTIETEDIWLDPVKYTAYNTSSSISRFDWAEGNGIPGYVYPGITDKSIYNWEKVNTLGMNFGERDNFTYNVEFEQKILDDLTLNAGVFHQDFEEMTSYTVSQLNSATVVVDTNTHNPDGSVNPYFGLPMMAGPNDPDRFKHDIENTSYRAMVAYTPDFTGNNNWTKWLGRHQAVGLVSRYITNKDFYRTRYTIEDSDEGVNHRVIWTRNPNNDVDGNPTGYNLFSRSVKHMWYLATPGDAANGTVTQGADPFKPWSYEGNMQFFNWETNSWDSQRYKTSYLTHNVHTARSEREVDSISFGLTSFLWSDRIISTLGWRRDDYRGRASTDGVIFEQDRDENGQLVVKEPEMTNQERWVDGYFQSDAVFDRFQRWDKVVGETSTVGVVFRPFDSWNNIQSEFLRSLGFSYNRSDNFNPPDGAQVDAFGNTLGKPSGTGKDWGIQFSMFDNKLFARVNWFKATNDRERVNPKTTLSRLTDNIDTKIFRDGWARTIVLINEGYDPTDAESWKLTTELTDAENEALEPKIAEIWGQDFDYYADLPGKVFATRSAAAEGMEIQIVYNPVPNWTMKLTAASQETVYTDVLNEYFEWADVRMPVMQNIHAADYLNDLSFLKFTSESGVEYDLTDFWTSYGYNGNVRLDNPNHTNPSEYADVNLTPQVVQQTALEGQAAPGQRKWRGSMITNYSFVDNALDGLSIGGAVRWEDEAIIGYYGRPNPATDSTNLTLSDLDRPIYDDAHTYVDLWAGYRFDFPFFDNVDAKVKVNVVNVFEDGGLRPAAVNFDGTYSSYRIIDPRQFILTLDLSF